MNRLPSLDGLRAISCALVVFGHGLGHLIADGEAPPLLRPLLPILGNGHLGVSLFFVLSGYLITGILLREITLKGTLSIRTFYIRRSFRIFPAYYFYLLCAGLLTAFGIIDIPFRMFLSAGTYTWNYVHWSDSWYLGHTWSLSIEEQFYLLWPLTLLWFGPSKVKIIAIIVILGSPFIRALQYFGLPDSRPYIPIMLHTRMDTIMFGSLLALCATDDWMQKAIASMKHPWLRAGSIIFPFVLSPLLMRAFSGKYLMTIGYTMEGICLCGILLWVLNDQESPFAKLLNIRWLGWVGKLSYSVYLWQQLFLAGALPFVKFVPAAFALCLLAGAISYHLVEQPMLKVRERYFPS